MGFFLSWGSGTGFKKINFVEGGIQRIFVSIFVLDCWLWEGKKDIDRKEAIFISIFVLGRWL